MVAFVILRVWLCHPNIAKLYEIIGWFSCWLSPRTIGCSSSVPLNQSALPNTAYFIYHICTSSICMLTSGQFNYIEGHCQEIHVKHYPPSKKSACHRVFSLPPQILNCLSCFFIQTLKTKKTLAACEMIGCDQNPSAKVLEKSRQVSRPLCVSLCMF